MDNPNKRVRIEEEKEVIVVYSDNKSTFVFDKQDNMEVPKSNFETHMIPMQIVKRPIPPVLDKDKVNEFIKSLKEGADFPAIDVLEVNYKNQNYYYCFGGCHRWEAHKALNKKTIKAKIIPISPKGLNVYLGASNPFKE